MDLITAINNKDIVSLKKSLKNVDNIPDNLLKMVSKLYKQNQDPTYESIINILLDNGLHDKCGDQMEFKEPLNLDSAPKLGSGTYGTVFKVAGSRNFAVKEMYNDENGIKESTLKEVSLLKLARYNRNVLGIIGVVPRLDSVLLIMPLATMTIDKLPKTVEAYQKTIIFQILNGLAYCHSKCIIHGDIKEANVLIVDGKVKIADFGLANFNTRTYPKTCIVQTAWYRAPEVFLCTNYTPLIDVWSVGAILARALGFDIDGSSDEDQWQKVVNLLGSPPDAMLKNSRNPFHVDKKLKPNDFSQFDAAEKNSGNWDTKYSKTIGRYFYVDTTTKTSQWHRPTGYYHVPNYLPNQKEFLQKLLCYPDKRYTADEAMKDPYFKGGDSSLRDSLPLNPRFAQNLYFKGGVVDNYISQYPTRDCVQVVDKPIPKIQFTDFEERHIKILIEWIVEVLERFKTTNPTKILSILYLYEYLSIVELNRSGFQLIGCAVMFIALKMTDQTIEVEDLVYMTSNQVTGKEILNKEIEFCQVLNFNLIRSTVYDFEENIDFDKAIQLLAVPSKCLGMTQEQMAKLCKTK